jgi:hypothetical protein
LSAWLLKHLRSHPHDPLAHSLSQEVLGLIDTVTLALKNIDRDTAPEDADLILIRLRLRLRLAVETELLSERQGQDALNLADDIGRQLGGWQKHL